MSNEFRVNSLTENWQSSPDVTALPDGGFVAVWDSFYLDGDLDVYYVAMQRYDAAGQRVGSETIVDAVNGAASRDARIATLSDGGYAVTWAYGPDGVLDQTNVFARVYNANGTPRTDRTRVDTVASFEAVAPDVVATAGGGFKVLFGVDRSNVNWPEIYGRQFSAAGVPVGPDRVVNSVEHEFDQEYVRTAHLAGGGSVAVWNSEGTFEIGTDLDSNEVRGTVYGPGGSVLRADFHLTDNWGTVGSPYASGTGFDVTALANGGFAVSHVIHERTPKDVFYYGIEVQSFGGAGAPASAPFIAVTSTESIDSSRVTQLETGQIVVIWEQSIRPYIDFQSDILGRVFDTAGHPLGPAFEVQQNRYGEQTVPEVTALAGGGFVATWQSEDIDPDHEGISARIFGRGSAGNDVATVDATGMYYGLGGDDRVTGDGRDNVLSGGAGRDVILGLGGSDTISGGAGNDYVSGGGTGHNLLSGDAGDDAIRAGSGGDRLFGGSGIDRLFGGIGADTVFAGTGNDFVAAGQGNDVIVAVAGQNRLHGNIGDDMLLAGTGQDLMWGEAGVDRFVFRTAAQAGLGATHDVVADFETGRDHLDLSALNLAFVGGAMFSGHAHELRYAGGQLWADLDGDRAPDLQVQLVGAPVLHAGDLIL